MSKNINNILIPNVTRLPDQKKNEVNKLKNGQVSEFKELLNKEVTQQQIPNGIRLSSHAAKRLSERNMQVDKNEFFKLKGAIDKLKTKGGQDSLVITEQGAYIIDVKNNTIVTAIDKDSMNENVFTKIDSTIFVN